MREEGWVEGSLMVEGMREGRVVVHWVLKMELWLGCKMHESIC